MPEKRPIVLDANGELEQLQPGDTIAGVLTSGNIDGGSWDTNYGGTNLVDGGTF
jgi:hypothetical protein